MYIFQVKQKDRTKILPVFHLLIALIFILDLSHVHQEGKKDAIFFAVNLIGSLFLLISGIFHKKIISSLSKDLSLFLFESVLVFGAAIYFWSKGGSLVAVSHVILAGVILLFWIYIKKREYGEQIAVSEKHIILPGLSGDRIIEWAELINLVKKHDLLTLDFKNNKLLQVLLIGGDEIDETEFNKFCHEQLQKNTKAGV